MMFNDVGHIGILDIQQKKYCFSSNLRNELTDELASLTLTALVTLSTS